MKMKVSLVASRCEGLPGFGGGGLLVQTVKELPGIYTGMVLVDSLDFASLQPQGCSSVRRVSA